MTQRLIKFRAWSGERMIHFGFPFEEIDQGYIIDSDFSLKEDTPIMQFTGLLDKNGKEIYEGDVVYCKDEVGEWKVNVVFDTQPFGGGVAGFYPAGLNQKEWEVIGNIYENPELLGGAKREEI